MFQHYVPRTYLDGFISPIVAEGHAPWLWVTDKKQHSNKRRSPKNAGGATNYYEQVGVTGGLGAGLESRLARVEQSVKATVAQLSVKDHQVGELGRDFSWFLATLCVRTPWAKAALESHLAAHADEQAGDDFERWSASVEYLASWASEYFRRMDWVRCIPIGSEDFFITSDRPVVLTGGDMTGSIMDVLRMTDRSSIVSVPLSARVALVGSYDRATVLSAGVTTAQLNDRTFDHATRYVFSPEELHWTQ